MGDRSGSSVKDPGQYSTPWTLLLMLCLCLPKFRVGIFVEDALNSVDIAQCHAAWVFMPFFSAADLFPCLYILLICSLFGTINLAVWVF
jgi:hypothetical protein